MIKAKLSGKDGEPPLFLLGLDAGNVKRLQEGSPILVSLRELDGPRIKVAIDYGETMEALLTKLRGLGLDLPEMPQPGPGETVVAIQPASNEEAPGATGEFPRGKLRADDEGGLRAAMAIKDGSLIVDFGKPVSWLGFGVADVEGLIATLQAKLELMRRAGA